ncbi:MAG: FAD-dependent oxidoreductase [Thermoguttaceae bacterium]|nr:FAD-dependent oxidoreductase [Thermoguttaceae bacterium]
MTFIFHPFTAIFLFFMLTFGPISSVAVSAPSPDKADTCDVLVTGGGTAGVVAAIQSGRAGVKTILLEAMGQLGGNATIGGVNSPESFFRDGEQRIKGIGWEWCKKTAELDDNILPDSKKHYRINPGLFAAVGEELCLQAGVQLRYFECPMSIEKIIDKESEYHWLVKTSAMGKVRVIQAKVLVDCTGNGTVAALAGAERMREKEIMAGSFNFIIEHNIDLQKLGHEEFAKQYRKALDEGRLLEGDTRNGIEAILSYQAGNYVYNADNSTAELRTDTNIRGRQMALRVLRFLRTLPGGENARITSMFPEVGVRETYRVKGEYIITVEDYLSGKHWDDSVCYACYQIDMHKPRWDDFIRIQIKKGVRPTVPLRCLIAKDIDYLLMAGRCLSSDRLALSALRIQATCMATGQAAGAAAALAAKTETAPKNLDPKLVRELLKKNDAIVP